MAVAYLFPYEKIEPGKRIVIYAYGKAGKSYLDQLKINHYCEVVAVIDRDPAKRCCTGFKLRSLENIPDDKCYDHLIIALESAYERQIVREALLEHGVDPEKIIDSKPHKFSPSSGLHLKPDLSNSGEIVEFVFRNADMPYESYRDLINDIMAHNEKDPSFLRKVKECLTHEKAMDAKMVLLQLFFSARVFDAQLMKLYLDTARSLHDTGWMYYFFRISTTMVFFHPEYLYKEFYLERREWMKELAQWFRLIPAQDMLRHKNGGKKRVAILGQSAGGTEALPAALVKEMAKQLHERGYTVKIVSDESNAHFDQVLCDCGKSALFPAHYNGYTNWERYNLHHDPIFYQNIGVAYAHSPSQAERLRCAVDAVYEFQPDCIIDYSNEQSILSAVFYGKCPVICSPMRGYCSSAFFDRFIARDTRVCLFENEESKTMHESQMLDFSLHAPLPAEKNVYQRKDYGITEEDFVLTTVGSRLYEELKEDLIDHICTLLRDNQDMKWILVGPSVPNYIHSKYGDLLRNRQVILWGWEEDLVAFYRLCDVFVNPDRKGGGASLEWALSMGLPVAMTKREFSDSDRCIKKYTIDGDYGDLAKYVLRLKQDKILYQEVSEDGIRTIESIRGKAWDCLAEHIEHLIRTWGSVQ